MKPISIAFQCFGPYLERQFIDFTAMGRDGIFLICGDTGAGKTTVLDAISCALYGFATDRRRGKTATLRSEFAPEDRKTEVEFIFEHNGIQYRFYRSLLPKKKLEDPKKQEGFAEATQVKENGALTDRFHVVFECERQVGEGNRVSVWEGAKKGMSSNAAKEVIGLNHKQFSQIVILPQGQFETFIMSPSGQKEEILKSLFHTQRWEDAVNKIEREAQEEEISLGNDRAFIRGYLVDRKCETVEELVEKATMAEAQEAETGKQMTAAQDLLKKAEQEQALALQMRFEFEELERTERELNKLLSLREEKQEEERLLKKAEQAEALREEYAACQKKGKHYITLEESHASEVRLIADIEKKISESGKILSNVRKTIWDRYGEIKTDTPRDKEYIGLLIEEFSKICDWLSCWYEEKFSGDRTEASTEESSHKEAVKQRAVEILEIIGTVDDELREYIEKERNIAANKGKDAGVKRRIKRDMESMERRKAEAYVKWEPIKSQWDSFRTENGFESDEEYLALSMTAAEKTECIRSLAQYDDRVKNAKRAYDRMLQRLKGREKPDIDELTERVQRIRNQYNELKVACREMQKLREDKETLRQIKELHEKNRQREATLERRKGFIKMLKGSHGVGIQRYILGVMLSTVIREANHILQTVLEGRYTIHRTDEGAGKKGLELAVCSYGEGEGRLVKTLSGGEKFLISLCLAIGLSSVVQAQGGGRVEALFVDEGFGTLDRERLDDAVNILQMSRRETDVIGIISHVEALREIIPAKIRIQKAKIGSTLLVEA